VVGGDPAAPAQRIAVSVDRCGVTRTEQPRRDVSPLHSYRYSAVDSTIDRIRSLALALGFLIDLG